MGFFFIGYLFSVFILLRNINIPLELVSGSIFFGGAVFVFLVMHLSRNTIKRINASESELKLAKENLEQDIDIRKQKEQALRESEVKYRQIFENIQDVYYEIDLAGKILEISPSIKDISLYTRDELIGKSLSEFFSDAESREEFVKTLLEKYKLNDYEIMVTDKDKSSKACSLVATLVSDNQGNPLKIVGSIRDLSERKQAEKEKALLQNQLQQAYRIEALGTLAGGIAHDFNNILSSILGYVDLALEDVQKGTLLESNLREVFTAGNRAKALVKQILTFARQADEEQIPVRVSAIAAEALRLIRSTIPTSIEIKQAIDCDSLVIADPTQIHQIFMNICTNAAHAMEVAGGVMEVNLTDISLDKSFTTRHPELEPGDYLKLSISDTGTGISPDTIGQIFDPYFTTKKAGEGTGMGLAMVHGIVKNCSGEITLESKVGKGTVFTIYLPVAKRRPVPESQPPQELLIGTESILVVDDEPTIAKITSLALERLGYKVSIRTSSIEALELFRSKPNGFDLVITDMTMPNMNGDRLAAELIAIRSDIPVILCTGYSKTISKEKAVAIGIRAFLMKPIPKSDLAKTVRQLLDKPEKTELPFMDPLL